MKRGYNKSVVATADNAADSLRSGSLHPAVPHFKRLQNTKMPGDESFRDLISHRGFDRYQAGLVSRFRADSIGYSVTYGSLTSKPSMSLEFETDNAVGRVTVWESGECDLEVLEVSTGRDLLLEHHVFTSTDEFHAVYPRVPLLLRKLRGDALPIGE